MSEGNNLLINIASDNEFKYLLLEKRQPITRFSLGPAGSWLGFAQHLSFLICGMAAWGLRPPSHLESLGVQDVFKDARNNFSFCISFRKCHLTHQDATCPPFLALDPWRTGRVLERSHGVQDIHMDIRNHFSFCAPFRKCHLTHQDSTFPPSQELILWRTGKVQDRSLHFNVSNNSTFLYYLKQYNFVHLVARKWTPLKV